MPRTARSRAHIASLLRKDCAQLFCIFTGRAGRLMMSPMDFLQRTSLLNRNLILFRDPLKDDYRRGVGGTITDFADLVEWQRQQYRRLPHVKETYCVGTSMGALAAIRFGYHLRANTVWAFAPRPSAWYRALRIVSDLVDLLATGNGKTEYRIYYSIKSRADRFLARTLSTCPGVVCCPQDIKTSWFGHLIVPALLRTDVVSQLFPPFVPSDTERSKGLPGR